MKNNMATQVLIQEMICFGDYNLVIGTVNKGVLHSGDRFVKLFKRDPSTLRAGHAVMFDEMYINLPINKIWLNTTFETDSVGEGWHFSAAVAGDLVLPLLAGDVVETASISDPIHEGLPSSHRRITQLDLLNDNIPPEVRSAEVVVRLHALTNDASAINILHFGESFWLRKRTMATCTWKSGPETHRQNALELSQILNRSHAILFNSMIATTEDMPIESERSTATIEVLSHNLKVSPTSDLWFKTSSWPWDKKESQRAAFAGLVKQETTVEALNLSCYPTTLVTQIQLVGEFDDDWISEWLFSTISAGLDFVDFGFHIFGYADYHLQGTHHQNLYRDDLDRWDELGDSEEAIEGRFDDLHRFLIGDAMLCQSIASKVEGDFKFKQLPRSSSSQQLAILLLPWSNIDASDRFIRFADWILPSPD
jgi:hypothetical protein